MPKNTKLKLLPVNKDAPGPPEGNFIFVDKFYLYESNPECWTAWKVAGKKTEPLGVAYKTAGDRWGFFCTRLSPIKLLTVQDSVSDLAENLYETFG
jgi:hypothetical protein